jgi:dimethylargininase
MKIVALVRKPSELIALDCISSHPLKNTIKYSTVMEQWQNYRNTLATFVDELVELPELPHKCPDSCFVEDLMVASGDRIVLNRMGALVRRQESESAKEVLEERFSNNNKVKLYDMRQSSSNKNETVDGGDCLFTEKHLFVGLSRRTNLEGYEYLKNVFSNQSVKVVSVKVPENELHLKGLMTYIHPLQQHQQQQNGNGKGTLVFYDNEDGREVYEELIIKVISLKDDYNILFVGDLISCNVLSIPHRNVVLVSDNCQKTVELYREKLKGYKVLTLDSSELVKADGRLTCQSVLITLTE